MTPADHKPATAHLRQVAGALLVHPDGTVLLHHRDETPGITNSGKWALFGGHIEPGETPAAAITRELEEELTFRAGHVQHFVTLLGHDTVYFMHLTRITARLEQLQLNEGQGMAYWRPEDALETLDLTTSGRAVLEMFLTYRKFQHAENAKTVS